MLLLPTHEHEDPIKKAAHPNGGGHGHACPGSAARTLPKRSKAAGKKASDIPSELGQWPVQLTLVNPQAPYFRSADLLLAADCAPFAMADFHGKLLRGKALVIGCPKLDDSRFYAEKLTAILQESAPRSLTVVHMEVPCCFGLNSIAASALAQSKSSIPAREVTVSVGGEIIAETPLPV